MTVPETFPRSERSRARRMHERASSDRAAVHALVDSQPLCHVGYEIDGQPYVTPTLCWREGERIYWHGSAASRMLRAVEDRPVCLTLTHLDGLVLARSAFHHSVNYRSAMLFGIARRVQDPAAHAAALQAMVERFYPGRWDALRPVTAQELKATRVLYLEPEEAVVKARSGPPADDAADLDTPVWAGVVPLAQALGEPLPDPSARQGGTPAVRWGALRWPPSR